MTDEPPESQPPWPANEQQPYFYAPPQPGYTQRPHQAMAPLFGNDSDTMTRWRPSASRTSKILIVEACAVAAVAVGIVAGVLVSSSKPVASTSSAAAAVPPLAAASTAAPSAAPAFSPAASGVGGVPSWWASYGSPAVHQIVKTMAQLKTDATNAETTDDLSAVEADLATAQGEIDAAQADPPIPDATLEQLWSTALADYGSGVSAMLTGVQNNLETSEIDEGAAEALDGNTPMHALVSDIDGLGS